MVYLSSKNPGKKNKVKLERAAEEKAAADRKKAKKSASKDEMADIKAKEREAKQKAKEKAQKAKQKEKERKAAEKEKRKQLEEEYDAQIERAEDIVRKQYKDDAYDESGREILERSDDESEDSELFEESASTQRICLYCGENPAQTGKEYCSRCEKALKKTRLPVGGFVAALVAVIASLFVLIIMGLQSAASLQIAKGNYFVYKHNYNTAFTVYDDVSGIISTVTDNFGESSVFSKLISTGSAFDMKAMECASDMYGPLDAIQSFDSSIFRSNGAYDYKQHSQRYKKLYKETEDFTSTISVINDLLTEITSDENVTLEEFDKRIPEIEAFKGKEGVNDVYLEYVIAMVAEQAFGVEDAQLLSYVKKVDEAAKADGGDYSWLYYEMYTTLLVGEGDYESATPYLMDMMNKDVSNYYSRIQMCRILVSRGKTDEAAAIANEYQSNNLIDDDYTEDAYALLIYMSRALGDYESALHYAKSALNSYTYVPEIRRQQALAYMSMGYYAEAFDAAYQASSDANYISSYYAISNFDGILLDETLYIAAYLAKDVIEEDSEAAANYETVIATYSAGDYVPAFAQKVIDGKIDVNKALTEGTCDFI